ncbi:hypothetical protein [Desulfoscipio gibsoniae]|uniref:Uncharacterized protein n=1 Tax=Desulfoscipio gibsoniae DSM 7213 TaxID=767817 RepID=R4KL93_9FIRM|nr:hypothetical protein [Desulfoscipio gibsoniae]AGL01300.1 hypothetical protein Desgi_1852 [Desulfoscipio gibsoniae DSM 7213]
MIIVIFQSLVELDWIRKEVYRFLFFEPEQKAGYAAAENIE